MPFVNAQVSVNVEPKQEQWLKERMGRAIGLIPGKSEGNLLFGLHGGCHLFLAGMNNEPVGYIEVNIYGNEDHVGFDRFTLAMSEAFHEVLHIPMENIYVRFCDITAWGMEGVFIDSGRRKA